MVEKSESKFKNYLVNKFGKEAYIHKMADYKQIGDSSQRGLPDYLVIYAGHTFWFEVKKCSAKKMFNFNCIRESQWIEFSKMYRSRAMIFFAILMNKKFYLIDFKLVYDIFGKGIKAIDIHYLEQYSKITESVLNEYGKLC